VTLSKIRFSPWLAGLVLLATSRIALAHEDLGGVGFAAGLLHPALGFDHFLAMLSVGILSAQIGGTAIWYVPGAFVGVMILGGAAAMAGAPLSFVETGIAASVFILGAALSIGRGVSWWLAIPCVAFFAVFHGHAHGTEMPVIADPWIYGLGFVLGTATIHLTGVSIGLIAKRFDPGYTGLRVLGVLIAASGAYLLVGST
jgi:urease accessory protein